MRTALTGAAVVLLASAGHTPAGEFGSADEAKAMLENAVIALKTDKADALRQISAGTTGFRDRDLYPFCVGPDGNFSAHPALVGQSLKDLTDKSGKSLGQEMYEAAREGRISRVDYVWPHPGMATPVAKAIYVTRVDDQVCAVRYYK
jgi:signal transduction histidine kinase